MNSFSFRRLASATLCATLLSACVAPNVTTDAADDALPACTAKGSPFEGVTPFSWSAREKRWGDLAWSGTYHERVGTVVDEYLRAIGGERESADAANGQKNRQILRCTADDYRSVVPAGSALTQLARELPPWADMEEDSLSAADAGAVLLEYLRTYECALREQRTFLRENILSETATIQPARNLNQGELEREVDRRRAMIDDELRIARPALERTLLILGGMLRLHPLVADLQCIERASLDLRNALSLFSEAASCMGRAVDTRSPLRY